MTKKAESLARELIALSLNFSARDFAEAWELIGDGAFFASAVRSSKRAVEKRNAMPLRARTRSSPKSQLSLKVDAPFVDVDPQIRNFVETYLAPNNNIRSNGVRLLANDLGLSLPKKLPNRGVLANRIMEKLQSLPEDQKHRVIDIFSRQIRPESSLKRWSALIVKDQQEK